MPELLKFDTHVETPLQPIYPKIGQAVFSVSPRLTESATELINSKCLEFFVHPEKGGFAFQAAGSSFAPGVRVGLGALEQTWAAVFGFLVFYEIIESQFNARLRGQPFPGDKHEHKEAAIKLLQWALSREHKSGRPPWPSHLPSPSRPCAMRIMRKVNVVYFRALGWMLAHELGHFAKGHLDGVESGSMSQILNTHTDLAHVIEHEADSWAHQMSIDPQNSINETACICSIGFALGIIGGICQVVTEDHPPISERIRRFFEAYVRPQWNKPHMPYNTALYATMTPLHALLYARGWKSQVVSFNDFPDYLAWWEATIATLPQDS